MERQNYTLTDLAGTHVAGRRILDRNATLLLTEEEARLEVLAGTIQPVKADAGAPPAEAPQESEALPAKPVSKRR